MHAGQPAAPRSVRRSGAIGGPRQPRTAKRKADRLLGVGLNDAPEEEGDGSGYVPPPEDWRPLPPCDDPGAARPYFVRAQNVVSTCTVNCRINPTLAAEACHGRYDPRIFPAATIPMTWPFATVCAFSSGKLVVAGARDPMQGLAAALLFLTKLRAYTRVDYRLFNFHVENVVGSASVGRRIRLAAVRDAHGGDCAYYPETFAGLKYRPKPRPSLPMFGKKRPVVILFGSGRMVICGAYSYEHLVETFLYMHEFVQPFLVHR